MTRALSRSPRSLPSNLNSRTGWSESVFSQRLQALFGSGVAMFQGMGDIVSDCSLSNPSNVSVGGSVCTGSSMEISVARGLTMAELHVIQRDRPFLKFKLEVLDVRAVQNRCRGLVKKRPCSSRCRL